jgi:hypothetical protein
MTCCGGAHSKKVRGRSIFRIKQLGFSVELQEKWSDDEHHRASLVMRRRRFGYIRTENLAVGLFFSSHAAVQGIGTLK